MISIYDDFTEIIKEYRQDKKSGAKRVLNMRVPEQGLKHTLADKTDGGKSRTDWLK